MNIIFFISGIYMATFAAAGLLFFKLYRRSGDPFFKYFSFACLSFSTERIAQLLLNDPFASNPSPQIEAEIWVYIFRLIGFSLILFAIIQKNRTAKN
jgi:hypothetical protein